LTFVWVYVAGLSTHPTPPTGAGRTGQRALQALHAARRGVLLVGGLQLQHALQALGCDRTVTVVGVKLDECVQGVLGWAFSASRELENCSLPPALSSAGPASGGAASGPGAAAAGAPAPPAPPSAPAKSIMLMLLSSSARGSVRLRVLLGAATTHALLVVP
jgi:hypothetical protein